MKKLPSRNRGWTNFGENTHSVSVNDYVFSHMSGPHTNLPSFLINYNKVGSVEDAEAYISRLRGVKTYLGQAQARAEAQFADGVSMPKFVYEKVSGASRNVMILPRMKFMK